jgi:cobalt-zinc-cadmium efflux system membrane fusion protein
MKIQNINFAILFLALFLASCGGSPEPDEHAHEEEGKAPTDIVHLVQEQMDVMGIEVGSFQEINLKTTIKANGQLDLPPQNKASVSALMPGRVKTISVIEGNYVKKGQVLARLEHPAYVEMQEEYLEIHAGLQFLEQDYMRKKKLLADSITAVKIYQEAVSKYNVSKAKLTALKTKLQLIGINVDALENGEVVSSIPVNSPIKGYVRLVEVNMGMSVQPEQEMFEIVDNEHIHIDLMVYEKDIDRVKEGQKVIFSLTTKPNEVFEGKVFAIGKAFENEPKAVIVHAEIENKTGNLLPGMYVDGRIETDFEKVRALADEAIVQDGGLSYIFVRETGRQPSAKNGHAYDDGHDQGTDHTDRDGHDHGEDHSVGDGHDHGDKIDHEGEYIFRKIEVNTGAKDIGFTEVVPAQKIPENAIVVTKGAFYLLAELKKGEGGGEHHH